MPEIPTWNVDRSAFVGSVQAHADPEALSAAARANEQGAREAMGQAEAFAERYAAARRQKQAADATAGAFDKLGDASFAASKIPDAAQAKAQFDTQAAQIKKDALAGISDPQVQAAITARIDDHAVALSQETRRQAFGLESSAARAKLDQRMQDYAHAVATAANPLIREQITKQAQDDVNSTVAAGWMHPEQAQEHVIKFKARVDLAEAEHDLVANPSLALKKLDDHANYPNLDEYRRGTLTARAENKVRTLDAQAQAVVRGKVNDNIASITNTGDPAQPLSDAQIRGAFHSNPAEGEDYIKALRQAGDVYKATQSVALISPGEDEAILKKFEPKGAGYADQLRAQNIVVSAVNAKIKGLNKDPADYVLSASPEIRQMYDDAAKDPAKLKDAVGALDAAYDKLGMPTWSRPMLPKSRADDLVQTILKQPADQRATAIAGMADKYGDLFPRMMGDMVKAGLPVGYNVLAAVPSSAARIALADALGDGKKIARDGLAPLDAKTIDQQIDEDPAMHDLATSFGHADAGGHTYEGIKQAVKLMAYRFGATMSPAQAARTAINSVTSDKYQLWQNGGGVARVPAGELGHVESLATETLSTLKPAQLAMPANPSGSKLTPAQLQDIVLSAARRGAWVTNESDDGIVRLDVNGSPVMLANGKRLEIYFQGAKTLGQVRKVVGGAPSGMDTGMPQP